MSNESRLVGSWRADGHIGNSRNEFVLPQSEMRMSPCTGIRDARILEAYLPRWSHFSEEAQRRGS